MEQGEADIMKRKPRNSKDGIFAGGLGFDIAFQGLLISIITLASYIIGHCMEVGYFEMPPRRQRRRHDHGLPDHEHVRDLPQLQHAQPAQERVHPAHPQQGAVGRHAGSLVLTTVVLEVPFVADLFGFTPVDLNEYLVALSWLSWSSPIVEIVKAIQRSIAQLQGSLSRLRFAVKTFRTGLAPLWVGRRPVLQAPDVKPEKISTRFFTKK